MQEIKKNKTNRYIINNIHKIYNEYKIPKTLQEHMLRCAAVCKIIIEHWHGTELNSEDIIATMLIHDMGNIIKFKFDSEFNKSMFSEGEIKIYQKIQKDMTKKYGNDSEKANIKIAKEIGANKRIISLLENFSYELMIETYKSQDFDQKICKYSDLRVAPFGVVSIEDRHKEALKRYPNYGTDPKLKHLKEAAFKIEQQILKNTDLKPENINDESIKKFII